MSEWLIKTQICQAYMHANDINDHCGILLMCADLIGFLCYSFVIISLLHASMQNK